MNTIRRLIFGELARSIAFVTLCFLALFYFFDFVDELGALSRTASQGYQLRHAMLYVLLLMPNRLYELLPITVLIGSVFVMSRLAQSSEYTILRTSGLGPVKALRLLMGMGLFFTILTFAVGDYLAPAADRSAQLLKARYTGALSIGQTGAWLKERRDGQHFAVNVGALTGQGTMKQVYVVEFDPKGFVRSTIKAEQAQFSSDDRWHLMEVDRTQFRADPASTAGAATVRVQREKLPQYQWETTLTAEMVSTALLRPNRMKAVDLFQYMRHLAANGQTAQRYEIEFWRKVFYPLSCLVMVILALPFAYLHFRKGSAAGYIFAGVMIGISFFLLNNVFGFVGNLRNWEPWVAAASPGLLYLLISLSAFGWLVLRR
jgi:lipopolysaccharide export system permease protein